MGQNFVKYHVWGYFGTILLYIDDIVKYLVKNDHRFFGSIIVAAWGGAPAYHDVSMKADDELLKDLDRGFGVLEFNGSQSYFALDGQHRLAAIKKAIFCQVHSLAGIYAPK